MRTIDKETLDRYIEAAREFQDAQQSKPPVHPQLAERIQAELQPPPAEGEKTDTSPSGDR
jgi:hypothetical protein